MAFNTLAFLLFFIFVLIGFYMTPRKYRWIFLLLSSYFFYFYANVKFAFFIILTTITSYYAALHIQQLHKEEKQLAKHVDLPLEVRKKRKAAMKKKRKHTLVSLLILNFGILIVLKYLNFFSENINSVLEALSYSAKLPMLNLILPLGISFYTFQTMSYVIDVYWGKIEAEMNFAKVALFVSFFPQIIEGPIGRYKDLAPQLYSEKKGSVKHVISGIQLMMWGYFKKMVIADRVAIVADYVFDNYLHVSGLGVVIGVFLYAMQDYTDFSGCIDIARGCAQSMGIEMAENFRRPYFSKTIPEFWRRWHMSLGAWMKDYVFYPFSLTKGMRTLSKKIKKNLGKFMSRTLPVAIGNVLVFFLVGVWHGASWNYILWGLFYGLLIAFSSLLKPFFTWMLKILRIKDNSITFMLFQIVRTFYITCIGCIIFRAASLGAALDILLKSFHLFPLPNNLVNELLSFGLDSWNYAILIISFFILLIVDIMQEHMVVREWLEKRNAFTRWSIYFIGFMIILIFGVYGPGIAPTQFVYMQF